jgi:hypothetical protein
MVTDFRDFPINYFCYAKRVKRSGYYSKMVC